MKFQITLVLLGLSQHTLSAAVRATGTELIVRQDPPEESPQPLVEDPWDGQSIRGPTVDGTCGAQTGYICPETICCSLYGFCGTGDDYCTHPQCEYGACPNVTVPDPLTPPPVSNCVVQLIEPPFCGTFPAIVDGPSCLSAAATCFIEATNLRQHLDDITSDEGEVKSGTLGVGAYDKLDIFTDVCHKMMAFCQVVQDYHLP